jgi:hypothetical protein
MGDGRSTVAAIAIESSTILAQLAVNHGGVQPAAQNHRRTDLFVSIRTTCLYSAHYIRQVRDRSQFDLPDRLLRQQRLARDSK